jgi:ATPase subunit of ABC transporter with duplicated ATPase domains
MHSVLSKQFFSKTFTKSLSTAAWSFENGAKVSLMGTNVAKANLLNSIEKEGSAVRLSGIPRDDYNSTVSAYLKKSVPEGANVEKILQEAKLGSRLGSTTIGSLGEGERRRLQLAVTAAQAPDVLIIDQPTHAPMGSELSMDDVKALSEMISKYPKTCVVNSSDASFLSSFTNSVLNVSADGNVEQLRGTYAAAQDTLAARYQAVAGPTVSKMSLKEKAAWLALLLPIEMLIFWGLTYAGR